MGSRATAAGSAPLISAAHRAKQLVIKRSFTMRGKLAAKLNESSYGIGS